MAIESESGHLPKGLSESEVTERLSRYGYNELPKAKSEGIFKIVWKILSEPIFLLLIFCGALYFALGEKSEAFLLMGFVAVIIGITLFQERRTEKALEALRNLSSPRALVVRDGRQKRIPARFLVPDDVILIAEGDRVPGDAIVVSAVNLTVDESLLTGESAPVRKKEAQTSEPIGRPGGEGLPFVYSGTLVVKGQGIARVAHTGVQTEMGKIGKALEGVEQEKTTLQRQTQRIVRDFSIVGLVLCVLVVVVFGLTRHDWLHGFLAGLTLAMATLPEEFPVVLTVFLALGAWRISHKQVLTRRVPAVETLGSTTVLCVDKTGTLTLNLQRVTHLGAGGGMYEVAGNINSLPDRLHELVEFSILASPANPFDPMEKAMKELGERTLSHTEHLHRDWTLIREYPLSESLLAMSRVWRAPNGTECVIASKGAPEAIADLCHFNAEQMDKLRQEINSMADLGLRVIAVARAFFRPAELPPGQHDFKFEFLGLLGLSDPVRPEVPEAIRDCYAAGVRVIMITGDYPGTAQNIARQIGLNSPELALTGPEIEQMGDEELRERLGIVNICARVLPEQKLRIVNALKAAGEIVAMTGDGVNDAPALKSAHIGIAMGGRGTDVAREASDLVLLDDNFASIVQAVRLGRRIFDNLRKAMSFIVSAHIPIAGLSFISALLMNLKEGLLLPVHVVFLELIIDPACSVVFEAEQEEPDVMRRQPRKVNVPLFSWPAIVRSVLQGLSVLAIILVVKTFITTVSSKEEEVRAACFVTLVMGNLGLIISNRVWVPSLFGAFRRPNPALWWVIGGAMAFLGLALWVPFLRKLFHFELLHPIDLAVAFSGGIVSIVMSEFLKRIYRRQEE